MLRDFNSVADDEGSHVTNNEHLVEHITKIESPGSLEIDEYEFGSGMAEVVDTFFIDVNDIDPAAVRNGIE